MSSTADYVNGFGYLHGDGFVGSTAWSATPGSLCQLTNNTAVDPLFALTGYWNLYYLQQSSPPSPMIDAGSDWASVIYDFNAGDWTTDPSDPITNPSDPPPVPDTDMVDLGYHQLPPY